VKKKTPPNPLEPAYMQPNMIVCKPIWQVVANKLGCARYLRVGAVLDAVFHIGHSACKLMGEKLRAPHERVDQIAALLANQHGGLLRGFIGANNGSLAMTWSVAAVVLLPRVSLHVFVQSPPPELR
jgi:hypothetical protein